MKDSNKLLYSIYLLSILANLLLVYFLYQQISGVRALKESWFNASYQHISNATQLLEVESNLGYFGFIHHFKNYVIQRSDVNYKKVVNSYQKTRESLHQLKALTNTEEELIAIQTLENTLDKYHEKINAIEKNHRDLNIVEIEQQLELDDREAEFAKQDLRNRIIPHLLTTQATAENGIQSFYQSTLYACMWLFPILILSTYVTARTLKRFILISDELNTIFNGSPDGIIYTDENGQIIQVNDAATEIFGYSEQEFRQLRIEDLVADSLRDMHTAIRKEFMQKEQSREMGERDSKIQGVRKDGKAIELRITISVRRVDDEMRSVCIVRDVTQQNELAEISKTDQLTSIKNRRYLEEILEKELNRSQRENKTLTLIIIDLDHFKEINDSHGHLAGDQVLKHVAWFLQSLTRGYDHLVRWGGDEFIILCSNLSLEHVFNYSERIRKSFEHLSFPNKDNMTLSIGVASTNNDYPMSTTELINAADKALYDAKESGRNRIRYFNEF